MRFCPTCGSRFSNDTRYCPLDGQPTQERASVPAPADPLIGKVLDNRYRIDRSVGEGGMGVVYLATHVTLNKKMAVKVLRHEMARDPDVVARFIQEAQASSAIGHPNIIDISDFGRLPDGAVYFVMEYLEGEPLTDMITGTGGIPLRDAVPIIEMIASALSAAHQRGIVHRDMKPDNVFLISRGHTRNFVKVLDFGIAKVGGASSKLTKTGMVFGTPHYMSPEQAAGQSVDARTDIYALGVIMYEMCTGKVPFDADTFMGILTKHMFEPPRPPTELGHAELGPLEPVILKALSKKPEQRYQSMDELLADLAIVKAGGRVEGPTAVPPPTNLGPALERSMQAGAAVGPTRKSGKGMVLLVSALSLLLVGLVAGGVVAYRHRAEDWASAQASLPPPGSAPIPPTAPAVPPPTAPIPTANVPIGEAPPTGPVGQVELVTTPSGAEAYVGTVLVGVTPLPFPRPTQRGDVQIELRLPGYQPRIVHVTAESLPRMEIPLERAQAGTASPSTPSSTTSAGGSRPRQGGEAAVTTPTPRIEAPSPMTGGGMSGGGPAEVLDPWAE